MADRAATGTAADATSLERAAALVGTHPWVDRAWVDGDLVRARTAPSALEVRPEPGPLIRDFLGNWAEVYDWVYESGDGRHATDLDLSGWRASDTSRPFDTAHMTEWVERTVDLVLARRPRVVLELGVGSGLLLHRLHRHVVGYVGTDVAPAAVGRLRDLRLPRVAVLAAAAHEVGSPAVRRAVEDLAGDGARPDCVLLNSVTQHFPNVAYLAAVIHGAVREVAAGGTVVIGDVRHHGLLDHYCRWRRAAAGAIPAGTAGRAPVGDGDDVAALAGREEEMLLDPRLIAALAAGAGRRVSISVHAKTMRDDTELTRYRYDVVLGVDRPPAPPPRRLTWRDLGGDGLRAVAGYARAGSPLLVEKIPNSLLVGASPVGALPVGVQGAVSGHDLRAAMAGTDAAVCVDLTEPTALAVAVPAASAAVPVDAVAVPAGVPLAHEPLPRFVAHRLPEVLRDHVRRADRTLPRLRIEVG